MNHKNRNSLLIGTIVLLLAVLACNPPTPQPMSTLGTPTATAAQQAGGGNPTDTPAPTLAGAPAPTEIPVTDTPAPTVCVFDSGFVADVTIPDDTVFLPNTAFKKTWRIKNTGGCGWEGMKLVHVSGDSMGDAAAVAVPPTAVGATVDVSKDFVSPGSPGTYRSNWQVQRPDGTKFGQQFYVQIVVPEPTATPTNTPLPTVAPTAKPVGSWPIVQYPDKGVYVTAVQYLLRAEGYALAADGTFGPQTRSAVKSFQGTKGLAVDGIVGPNTWQALVQDNTVKGGNSGDAVWAVQHLLKYKHGYDVTVDGMFGRGTDAAVRDLQETYGLVVDGIVGINTWKALVAGL